MNPDIYSPEYQGAVAARAREEARLGQRRAELHRRAVARRRRRKSGGPK